MESRPRPRDLIESRFRWSPGSDCGPLPKDLMDSRFRLRPPAQGSDGVLVQNVAAPRGYDGVLVQIVAPFQYLMELRFRLWPRVQGI